MTFLSVPQPVFSAKHPEVIDLDRHLAQPVTVAGSGSSTTFPATPPDSA